MKNSGLKRVCYRYLALVIISLPAFNSHASAETLDSVPHIHHVKVVENKVLVLTHAGLFELVGKNDMKLVSKDKFDVMGFTTLGKTLVASAGWCGAKQLKDRPELGAHRHLECVRVLYS